MVRGLAAAAAGALLALALAGCVSDSSFPVAERTSLSAADRQQELAFPHRMAWKPRDLQGDVVLRFDLAATVGADCDVVVGAQGRGGNGALNLFVARGEPWVPVTPAAANGFDQRVHLAGTEVFNSAGASSDTWSSRARVSLRNLTSPEPVLAAAAGVSAWGAPGLGQAAFVVDIACDGSFGMGNLGGSREMMVFHPDRMAGELGVQVGGFVSYGQALDLGRDFSSSEVLFIFSQHGVTGFEEQGRMVLNEPDGRHEWALDGRDVRDSIRGGPGVWGVQMQRLATGSYEWRGIVLGIESVPSLQRLLASADGIDR